MLPEIALADIEIIMRDFISLVMTKKHGTLWESKAKISPDRVKKWEEKKEEERKKQSGVIEERLIYYSDFYDLESLVEKNWDDYKPVFNDLSKFKFFFKIISDFRNSVAHHRELIPHQRDLINGVVGELRNSIVKFRSTIATGAEHFPRIELVIDNYGNRWAPGDSHVDTKIVLHPGEVLQFTIKAFDPKGGMIFYGLHPVRHWQESNEIVINLGNEHIGNKKHFVPCIKSNRDYHADGGLDDVASFSYYIYPKE